MIICIQCIPPNDLLTTFKAQSDNICFGHAGFIFRIGLCQFAKSKHLENPIETHRLMNLKLYTKKITLPSRDYWKNIYLSISTPVTFLVHNVQLTTVDLTVQIRTFGHVRLRSFHYFLENRKQNWKWFDLIII